MKEPTLKTHTVKAKAAAIMIKRPYPTVMGWISRGWVKATKIGTRHYFNEAQFLKLEKFSKNPATKERIHKSPQIKGDLRTRFNEAISNNKNDLARRVCDLEEVVIELAKRLPA